MAHRFVGIDHVQLAGPPGCEPAARRFYGEILRWAEVAKPEHLQQHGGLWFQCGTHQVHLGIQADFTPAAKAHPAFLLADLRAFREHVVRHGLLPIDDQPVPGAGWFYLADPFGNRLEFMEWHRASARASGGR